MKTTWKYTVIELRYKNGEELEMRDKLNELGKNGWELVCMEWYDCEISEDIKRVVCTFKQHDK